MSFFKLSDDFKSFLDDEHKFFAFSMQFYSGSDIGLSNLQLMSISQQNVSDNLKNTLAIFFNNRDFYMPNHFDPRWKLSLMELIKNSYDHGLAYERGLKTELYFGSQGVGFGIYDGGDFYNEPRVKTLVEGKKLPSREEFPSIYKSNPSYDSSLNSFRGRHGFEKIYKYSDFLEVDTVQGVLFLGFSRERLFRR